MAQNIYEVRQSVGGTLDRNVEKVCAEPVSSRVRLLDGRELRGWPAVGPLMASAAILGTQPGSDEHIDALDRFLSDGEAA